MQYRIEPEDGMVETHNDLESAKLIVLDHFPKGEAIEFGRFICKRANLYLLDGHKFIGQMVGGPEMGWEDDRTPGFSAIRIQRDILGPSGVPYRIKYGSGTISVELMDTTNRDIAEAVMSDMVFQGIKSTITETDHGFIISREVA